MTRRFRRRPSVTTSILLALAVVVLARYTYDRIVDRSGRAAAGLLREGDCEVVRVIDGDSIVVRQRVTHPTDAKRTPCEATIRLLGIDCPEFDEPLGAEAATTVRRLLAEGTVTLRFDRRRLDRYERFLAYVFVDDQMVNAALVRAGLARADVYPGDSQSAARNLFQAQAEAKAQRRGIWGRRHERQSRNHWAGAFLFFTMWKLDIGYLGSKSARNEPLSPEFSAAGGSLLVPRCLDPRHPSLKTKRP